MRGPSLSPLPHTSLGFSVHQRVRDTGKGLGSSVKGMKMIPAVETAGSGRAFNLPGTSSGAEGVQNTEHKEANHEHKAE